MLKLLEGRESGRDHVSLLPFSFLEYWTVFLSMKPKKKSAAELSFTCSVVFPAKPDPIYPAKDVNTGIIISIYNLMLHRCVLIRSYKGAF